MSIHETSTLSPHWGDAARAVYWRNPTAWEFTALTVAIIVVGSVAVLAAFCN